MGIDYRSANTYRSHRLRCCWPSSLESGSDREEQSSGCGPNHFGADISAVDRFPNRDQPRAANFFIQVSAGGMLSGLIMVLLLLRLVFQRALEPPFCRSMIRAIIDRCGCDPLDEFAVLRDKSYWLSDDRQLFFCFGEILLCA
jgi:hypothetical protein